MEEQEEDIDDYMKYVPPPDDDKSKKKRKFAGSNGGVPQKSIDTMMAENREVGLDKPIAADSVGYKLFHKFGFTPASASVITAPIKPIIRERNERTGIGIPTKVEQQQSIKVENSKHIHQLQESFIDNRKRVERANALQRALGKANRLIDEFRERVGATDDEGIVWLQETDLELALHERLSYLRDNHHYCMYCSHQYESAADLAELCPGVCERSHE